MAPFADSSASADSYSAADLELQNPADLLKWIGIALLGIYLATVLAAALPLKLLDPAWVNRVCGSLRGGVSFPLEALAFILVGSYLRGDPRELPLATTLRRLCSWVAIGFLLMIPLQSWAGQKLIGQAVEAQEARIKPGVKALKAVYAASNAEQLMGAIQMIPGAPPNIGGTFQEPVPKVRQRLISQIEPQVRQQQEQLSQLSAEIRSNGLIALVKDGLVALLSALAFAAIGRSRPYLPTLLQRLFGVPRFSPESSEGFRSMVKDFERSGEP